MRVFGRVTLREHLEALRAADDRRYAEVNIEREKALKIKETADLAALQLAREIQTYKDEKANELRSQIERERGSYPTRGELNAAIEKIAVTVKPAIDYAVSQQGRASGFSGLGSAIAIGASVVAVAVALFSVLTR